MSEPFLPLINADTSAPRAALAYVEAGIPIVPFDPSKGNGKQCWNLVSSRCTSTEGYHRVTTDKEQLKEWRQQFGRFEALATSPGAFGCLICDVDKPNKFPRSWRRYLEDETVPFVATRPHEHQRRGHYWFDISNSPASAFGNRSFEWGELRSLGGGIVLPPYQGRYVVRGGVPPVLADELVEAFTAGAGGCRSYFVSLSTFLEEYVTVTKPHKLEALVKLHAKLLTYKPPHDAMREALQVGFGEAVIGYVSAANVYNALLEHWDRPMSEFRSLARWCAGAALAQDPEMLKLKSDRLAGTDSRIYADYFKNQEATAN